MWLQFLLDLLYLAEEIMKPPKTVSFWLRRESYSVLFQSCFEGATADPTMLVV